MPEDVVDEEQHVLPLDVPEVLGQRESSETHSRARTWRLVHLPVHQRHLRLPSGDHSTDRCVYVVSIACPVIAGGEW